MGFTQILYIILNTSKMKIQILLLSLLISAFQVKAMEIERQDVEVIHAKNLETCEASTGKTCQNENYVSGACIFSAFMCKEHNLLWTPCCDEQYQCYCCYATEF